MAKDALSGGDGTQSPSPLPPMPDALLPPRTPPGEDSDARDQVRAPGAPGDPEQLRAAIEAALSSDGAAPPPGYAQATPFHQQVDPLPRRRFVPRARIPRPRMPDLRRAMPAGGISSATLGFLALMVLTLVLVYAFLSSFISWFSGLFG